MTTATDMIAAERDKQIAKGWTPVHDDRWTNSQLARAGISYGITAIWQMFGIEGDEIAAPGAPDSELEWPWRDQDYNPSEIALDNLVTAAALIAAEIDRQLRQGRPHD